MLSYKFYGDAASCYNLLYHHLHNDYMYLLDSSGANLVVSVDTDVAGPLTKSV